MSGQQGPSFTVVLGTVWKVICAILLIPFLILLVYVAWRVLVPDYMVETLIALVALFIAISWKLRRR